jgi:hypothetical protein
MFLVRLTTDVTLTFLHAWLKTFPTFPTYPTYPMLGDNRR